MISEVISIVQADGGRFVKYDPEYHVWIELEAYDIHEKVGHALRTKVSKPESQARAVIKSQRPSQKEKQASNDELTHEESMFYEELLVQQRLIFDGLLPEADRLEMREMVLI